jgi:hypothetical protein
LRKCWVIPPKHDAEFVACMEDVLDIYERPYDCRFPVVCMDEQPVQLINETRLELSIEPGQPQRYDYEYRRNGTAVNFMFTEPLASWRKVDIRETKTMIDWAEEIRILLDVDYADAEKVILICDNLNTHKIASLYVAFEPQQAKRLRDRLEMHYTPKHGSWLNIAEIELSLFTRQCLRGRIAHIETLQQQAQAWYKRRNVKQKSVDWQFTCEDARIKLKRLYPQF